MNIDSISSMPSIESYLVGVPSPVTTVRMTHLRAPTTIFFRHLPKTAGTSLITTLSNVFGDAHCHRFLGTGVDFGEVLDAGGELLSLVSGHVQLNVVEEGACGREFTVIREPIARLLSMRRFFEGLPESERNRLCLGNRVSVADLLTARNAETYGQVHNGLTRFFCGNTGFADPNNPDYWEGLPPTSAIDAADATLGRLAVGLTEDMPSTLRALGTILRVPYDLEIPVENATTDHDDDLSPQDLRALVEVNTADIALYHRARKRLVAAPALGHVVGADFDPRTLFDPQPGEHYAPPHIPGRQGFSTCEASPSALCWLGPEGRGRIHLAPSDRPLALSLVVYGVVPHYPMDDVTCTLDGRAWAREHRRGNNHSVFRLAPIPPHSGPVELAIKQPCSVTLSLVVPGSPDKRSLGVSLLRVICEAA